MDFTAAFDLLLNQGPLVSFMLVVIWYGVKAYRELFKLFLDQQKAHTDILVQTVNASTAALNANTTVLQQMKENNHVASNN